MSITKLQCKYSKAQIVEIRKLINETVNKRTKKLETEIDFLQKQIVSYEHTDNSLMTFINELEATMLKQAELISALKVVELL